MFTREGDFDVCGEAENGREAIEKAQLLRPNLIVTDLSMPVMNGLEETRVLKKLMPPVPVIIFTAHSDPFVEKEARAAGVSAPASQVRRVVRAVGMKAGQYLGCHFAGTSFCVESRTSLPNDATTMCGADVRRTSNYS